MTDIDMEERIAIRDWSLKKNYGSTSNNAKRYESFIKHQVGESDTLQGLALKYGVTTEQIRRANRLWANDSLFLRKFLFIPVTGDNVTSPSDVVLLEAEDVPTTSHAHNNNHHASASRENRGDEDYSYNDFLVKIDCAIASTKSQVMTSQDNSEFVDTDSIFWQRKGAMSRLKQQQQLQQEHQQQSIANGSDVPTVMTQGRKVRNSLQRLEKEQDEIFEL